MQKQRKRVVVTRVEAHRVVFYGTVARFHGSIAHTIGGIWIRSPSCAIFLRDSTWDGFYGFMHFAHRHGHNYATN